MNSQELDIAIAEGQTTFTEITFEGKIELSYIYVPNSNFIQFFRCEFNDLEITGFNNNTLSISFSHCSFEKVDVSACTLKEFRLSFIRAVNEVNIYNLTTDELTINSDSKPISADIYIDQSSVTDYVNVSKLNLSAGAFTMSLRNGRSSNSIATKGLFRNAILKSVNISAAFRDESDFQNLTLQSGFFDTCIFENISFKGSKFSGEVIFRNVLYNKNVLFEEIKSDTGTDLQFINSIFKSFISFNRCNLYKLTFNTCVFQDSALFQNAEFDFFKLDKSIFEKNAFFDDIQINKIYRCDRRTIRNIKLQLQKAENRIDYNRFRSYEMVAYYNELQWNWKDGKDKFILGATWLVTGFNHSWRRALAFTILAGLFWYSILYFTQYIGNFDVTEINTYFSGAFKFFLITDFSNPFEKKGEYFNLAINWLPLILGKIFIAFGIYEMIQAFRKFKA